MPDFDITYKHFKLEQTASQPLGLDFHLSPPPAKILYLDF